MAPTSGSPFLSAAAEEEPPPAAAAPATAADAEGGDEGDTGGADDGGSGGGLQDLELSALFARLSLSATTVLELLRSWDTDGNGVVGPGEFKKAIRHLGYRKYSDGDLERIFA